MKNIISQTPLYNFLKYCNERCSEKNILDCGAGGENPPLQLFSHYGYKTTGVEIDPDRINAAQRFSNTLDFNLDIMEGDMRNLPFQNCRFDCVYSYNSIFHMIKEDIVKSLHEMKRVLKPGGLLFVNFLSVDDFMCGTGEPMGNNEYRCSDSVIHSYHTDHEPDCLFSEMELIMKEKRIKKHKFEGKYISQGFIDYIVLKK